MKKILNLILLLCGFAIAAPAQKFSIGLRGGINYSTAPLDLKKEVPDLTDVSGSIGKAAGIRFMFDTRKIQVGLGAEWHGLGYGYNLNYSFAQTEYRIRQNVAQFLLFANYKTLLPRSYIYYGLCAGFTLIRDGWSDNTFQGRIRQNLYEGTLWSTPFDGKNILVFGLQAGYNYRISKHFSVSGEAALRYLPGEMFVNIHGLNYEPVTVWLRKGRGMLHFPVTAGINYTF